MEFAWWRRWRRPAPGTGPAADSGASPAAAPAAGPAAASAADGEAGRISRTSQAVALTRARIDRPHSPKGDPLAQARLCAGMRPAPIERLRPMLIARTRFFDEAVTTALAGGTDQVVICGAGYDDRALRFRTTGVRFFELDQGPTQADKARRLRELGELGELGPAHEVGEAGGAGEDGRGGLTLATADFRADDVAAVLAAHGHDKGRPTLFVCEGLLIYLAELILIRLLSGLASCAAAGSTLAASLAVHAEGLASAEVLAAANARRRAGETEPWRTILPRDEQIALLARTGWQTDQAVDAAELEDSAPAGRTVLVLAHPGR